MDKRFKLIEMYLDGELSAEEQKDFEKAIETDSRLKELFYLSIDINKSIVEDDVIDLRNKIEKIVTSEECTYKTGINRNFIRVLAAASIIVFIVIVKTLFLQNNQLTNQELYSNYFTVYNSVSYARTLVYIDDSLRKYQNSAFEFYINDEYDSSLIYFNKALIIDKDNILLNFYSGIVNMKLENYFEAETNLHFVVDNGENLFEEQAFWYLALLYIIQNKTDSAVVVLLDLQENSFKYKNKSKEILDIIKRD